ncbi:hypothetical protein M514_10128 [Trichuris suis]|uniref:Uncharacterized protein n=1 Tax=Trichuris suis TaxID=68888 RepID=A0A085N0F3_9BILA|nr:hypothetical protein M513_10128 [Trichuris suis]KFD62949.1 hypothetical protein M514_10128 [Trichuris suis]
MSIPYVCGNGKRFEVLAYDSGKKYQWKKGCSREQQLTDGQEKPISCCQRCAAKIATVGRQQSRGKIDHSS